MKYTITLTGEQATTLIHYLSITTNYRKKEREAWEELAKETKPDGTPRFPNAPSNVRFWEKTDQELEQIREIINNAPATDN